jgi:DNA-binding MarR family transcriptional regulator
VGVTQAEAHVLAYLAGHETCAINDLHRSFGHRRSTLTSVLDRIEGRGLARRGPHPTSRRSVMVHLTPEGRQIAHRVAAELSAIDAAVTAYTGREDLAAFMRVIDAIEEAVHD